MTVSRKHKRPIHVHGTDYLWWVATDDPLFSGSLGVSLSVVSEPGDFYVKYFWQRRISHPGKCLRTDHVVNRAFTKR